MKYHWLALLVVSAVAVAVTIKAPAHLTPQPLPPSQRSVAPAATRTVVPITLPEPIKRTAEVLLPTFPESIRQPTEEPTNSPSTTQSPASSCSSSPIFTNDVTDFSNIAKITPPGGYVGSVLKTHGFLWINGQGELPVYAPADMTLVRAVYTTPDAKTPPQYGLIFQGPCGLEIRFGHIDTPINEIRARITPTAKIADSRDDAVVPLAFKAGDVIAHTAGTLAAHNWDFGVYLDGHRNVFDDGKEPLTKDEKAVCGFDYYSTQRRAYFASRFVGTTGDGVPPQTLCAP